MSKFPEAPGNDWWITAGVIITVTLMVAFVWYAAHDRAENETEEAIAEVLYQIRAGV